MKITILGAGTITILGAGTMGSAFAEGLMKAGHELTVYNRTAPKLEPLKKLGVSISTSAIEAIENAEAIIVVVSNGKAVKELLLNEQMAKALSGKNILNASTTTIHEATDVSQAVLGFGSTFAALSIQVEIDQRRENQGTFLLGCSTSLETFWQDVLKDVGTIQRVGEADDVAKAQAPMLIGSMFMGMLVAYSSAIAIKLKVSEGVVTQQLSQFVPYVEYMIPGIYARNYDQVMASVNSFKDVALTAIDTANSLSIPTKIMEDILALYTEASESGYGDKDGTAIVELLLK